MAMRLTPMPLTAMPLTRMRRMPMARMGISLTHMITAILTATRITSLRWLCRPSRPSEAPRGLSRVICGRVVAFSLEVF